MRLARWCQQALLLWLRGPHARRDHGNRTPALVRYLGVALLLSVPAIGAHGGANSGGSARLSWSPNSYQPFLSSAADSVVLYLQFSGLTDVARLATVLQWAPTDSGGYNLVSDTTTTDVCGRLIDTNPNGAYLGDSSFTWTTVLPVVPPTCVRVVFRRSGTAVPAGSFCLSRASVEDQSGAVDELVVYNCASILDSTAFACPPSPLTITPASPMFQQSAGRSATAYRASGDHNPALVATIRGNALSHLASVVAESDGSSDSGIVLPNPTSALATILLPQLTGSGPWTLRLADSLGREVTLKLRPPTNTRIRATFDATITLPGSWNLPLQHAWSPNGRDLALNSYDGLFVLDAADPTALPVKLLSQPCDRIDWDPSGTWILALAEHDPDSIRTLHDLVAISCPTGAAHYVLRNADIGAFAWAPNGEIIYWDGLTGMERRLGAPEALPTRPAFSMPDRRKLLYTHAQHTRANSALTIDEDGHTADLRTPSISGGALVQRGCGPDASVILATLYHPSGDGESVLLDSGGSIISVLGHPSRSGGFEGTGLTIDGTVVIGQVVTEQDENDSWRLVTYDTTTGQVSPIAGVTDGKNPQLSCRYLMAFERASHTGLVVGLLEVSHE